MGIYINAYAYLPLFLVGIASKQNDLHDSAHVPGTAQVPVPGTMYHKTVYIYLIG